MENGQTVILITEFWISEMGILAVCDNKSTAMLYLASIAATTGEDLTSDKIRRSVTIGQREFELTNWPVFDLAAANKIRKERELCFTSP